MPQPIQSPNTKNKSSSRQIDPACSMTKIRASPTGTALCSSPTSATHIVPGTSLSTCSPPGVPVVHVHDAVDNDEHFGAIVDVPDVRTVSSMQAHSGVVDGREQLRTPRLLRGKFAGRHETHPLALHLPKSVTGRYRPAHGAAHTTVSCAQHSCELLFSGCIDTAPPAQT
ncbi:hypothetical protein ABIB34_000659 [Rhodococcus sp. UYP5]